MQLQSNSEWEALARTDPLFAIASDKGKRKSDAQWTTEEFFKKGIAYLDLLSPGLSKIVPGATVLEIGCGAGRITRALAARYRSVIGVDAAPSMVSLAKEMCRDIPNAEFRVGDGVILPATDQGVDAVVSVQVLQHIDRDAIPTILAECRRVLRPGGVIVLHIPSPWIMMFVRKWLTLVPVRRVVTRWVLRVAPRIDISRRGWVMGQYNTYTTSRIVGILKRNGFVGIETFQFRPGRPFSTVYVATVE